MKRLHRIVLIGLIILLGLFIRYGGPHLNFPYMITKFGGSILWATMVYFLATILAPGNSKQAGIWAFAIALLVEFSRLIHFDWLDHFRTTLAGALLLGRYFALINILAYAIGIGLGMWIDGRISKRIVRRS